MMFALMADANYKGFDLSVQFQGAALCDKMLQYSWQDLNGATDMTPMTRPWYANWDNAPLYLVENSWRPDHTNAEYPRLTVSSVSHSCPTIGFLEKKWCVFTFEERDFRIYAS